MTKMDEEDTPAIVIDSGSGTCHAGFAGSDAPTSAFSSVVGTSRYSSEGISSETCVGDNAQRARDFLSLNYPIERGIVTNWQDVEKLWEFCFKDLHVDSKDHAVFMSEPVLNPAGNREKMLQYMFERFNVPAFYSGSTSACSLYSRGRSLGLVLDIGEGVMSAVPIHSIQPIPHAVCRQELAGRDVTTYLQKLLYERGYSFTSTAEWEYVREIKEELGYVSLDFHHESEAEVKDMPFILPDGNRFMIGKERFQCAECLFQPSLIYPQDSGFKGMHELLQSCLEQCDIDIRRDFYSNIILSGGASMMPNMKERLSKLWQSMVPSTMRLRSNVLALPERKYSVWIGGSILASLSSFQEKWITKDEYEEYGPTISNRKLM